MLSGAQSPAHPRGAALSHPFLPGVCMGDSGGQGTLTNIQMQEVAPEGPLEAGQVQSGNRMETVPFPLLGVWPPALPACYPPTALAGKELTSQLRSKNVELLIPTASGLWLVCLGAGAELESEGAGGSRSGG